MSPETARDLNSVNDHFLMHRQIISNGRRSAGIGIVRDRLAPACVPLRRWTPVSCGTASTYTQRCDSAATDQREKKNIAEYVGPSSKGNQRVIVRFFF